MSPNPRMVSLLAALLLAAAPWSALAHAHLKTSTPANQATLGEAPASLRLEFSEAARLTALSLQATGETAARKLPLEGTTSAVSHTIALPPLTPGEYLVTWRALSDDTHVSSGTLRFTIRPK